MKIDRVVDLYVPSKVQRSLLLLFSLAWMVDAAGVMMMTFTLGGISSEWHLSTFQSSTIASLTFVGMLLGAIGSGFVLDLAGRKFAMNLFLAFTIFFTFIDGFSPSPFLFGIFRLLSGIGYGGLMPSVNAYLSESTSMKIRGRYLVLLESSWAVGSILIGLYAVTSGWGWRSVYYSILIGSLIFIPFLRIKESPRYIFLKKGKKGLEELLGFHLDEDVEKIEKSVIPVKALLGKRYFKSTILVWSSWFTISLIYYGLFTWLPKILSASGIGTNALWFTFFIFLAQLPGYLSAAYFIEKIGRKPSLILFFAGTAISSLIFSFVTNIYTLIIAGLVTSFFCMGVWGLVYAYTPELFPTSFRGSANGSAGMMARIAGIIAPYFVAAFFGTNVLHALIWFSILAFLMAFLTAFLGRETKAENIE
ncbi:MFS transporter [Athalassotoga saccharophila]|uniref:MFS transporter n=1 Tax=Athalassotoga saccharophila TaxID=1441386 RepID=UPI00137976E4|nr:MFS transporter [Athalassotoga saccharophila]BBJ27948.1 putative niacin/nicotinamide transporter NaiP [Athalassotoga saccharophila]